MSSSSFRSAHSLRIGFLWSVIVLVIGATATASTPSEQEAMLQFVSTFLCPVPSWSSGTPVCSCTGVSCDTNANVVAIQWRGDGCGGTVDLMWLQYLSNLQTLDLSNNQFSSTVDFSTLPSSMWTVALNNNQLTGTVSFINVSANLLHLDLSNN